MSQNPVNPNSLTDATINGARELLEAIKERKIQQAQEAAKQAQKAVEEARIAAEQAQEAQKQTQSNETAAKVVREALATAAKINQSLQAAIDLRPKAPITQAGLVNSVEQIGKLLISNPAAASKALDALLRQLQQHPDLLNSFVAAAAQALSDSKLVKTKDENNTAPLEEEVTIVVEEETSDSTQADQADSDNTPVKQAPPQLVISPTNSFVKKVGKILNELGKVTEELFKQGAEVAKNSNLTDSQKQIIVHATNVAGRAIIAGAIFAGAVSALMLLEQNIRKQYSNYEPEVVRTALKVMKFMTDNTMNNPQRTADNSRVNNTQGKPILI